MLFRVTASHYKGKSVSHPSSRGVYGDPTDTFCEDFDVADEGTAWRRGMALLLRDADDKEPCECGRALSPGSDSWVNSVALTVTKVGGV